jgi:hypothetical protein
MVDPKEREKLKQDLIQRDDMDSLSNFFRSLVVRPTSQELTQPVVQEKQEISPPKDALVEELLAQNSEERDQYYQDLLTGLQAGAGEFSMQPGQPEVYTGPTKEELFKSLIAAEQSQLSKEEQDDIKIAEEMLQDRKSLLEKEKKEAEEKPKDKEEFKLPPSDETSRYFNNPLELYKGIKDNDDKIMNYVYGGIAKKEWAGKKPIFDFVRISRKDKGKSTSSAFGPVQIVGSTVRDAMTRIKKGTEEYNFANRLQAAQNLFINLANKYKAGKNFNEQTAKETARTDSGKPALKILGITEDQFIDYVKDGYFLPSNQKKSKGLPPEILGDNYKENYYKLFKNVLSNKSVGTDSLKETIKKYYGHPSEKEKTRYMQDVYKNLNLSITQGK